MKSKIVKDDWIGRKHKEWWIEWIAMEEGWNDSCKAKMYTSKNIVIWREYKAII